MISRWAPLGETAALVWCDDEEAAANLAHAVRRQSWPWLVDVVQSYASVAVYFDRGVATANRHAEVIGHLAAIEKMPLAKASTHHVIPVCYERGLDLDAICRHTGCDVDTLIRLHSETVYTVYAIGFCPGFPYLGYLPEAIANVPRRGSPRVRLAAGSVGITGRQTGIYTEPRPGGWNIVGQTPLELVNVADNYFPLSTGDTVAFQPIREGEFQSLAGTRL